MIEIDSKGAARDVTVTPYWEKNYNTGKIVFYTLEQIRKLAYVGLDYIIKNPALYSPAMVIVAKHELKERDEQYITPNPKHAAPYNEEKTNNHAAFCEDLRIVLVELQAFLTQKNIKYGDSALNPSSCFSKGLSPLDGINIRLDDKIKRLMTGDTSEDEDVELDIIGYLIIKRIYLMRLKKGTSHECSNAN